ncbi:MAG: 4-alpha-glucanotransferase [Planctomycetes bacterium]|nr:4-alpha-glucanotransferase [Planctomycetota bacterium]
MTQRPPRTPRCADPRRILGRKGVGLWVNLYSLRSDGDHGVGDFGHLARLVRATAPLGIDFIGLNPLHQIENTAQRNSPYFPLSRRWRNPLYIDLNAVPELAASGRLKGIGARVRTRPHVDYDTVYAFKLERLRVAHRFFVKDHFEPRSPRGKDYAAFIERSGDELLRHVMTLVAGGDDRHAALPPRTRRAFDRFIEQRIEDLDFHAWLQFETARQLAAIDAEARALGMRLGLYHDLAIGAAPGSSEVLTDTDAYAAKTFLGAPPDGYSRNGQVWNLVPFDPAELQRRKGAPYASLVAANLDGGGMLRIDHVIGLARQYWIARGKSGRRGSFVPFPGPALFRLVARISQQRRAPIVGEDLGTIPRELPGLMRKYGVLSTRFMLFERDADGAFRAPARYPRESLATFANHDVVPLLGWLRGLDLPLRVKLGLLDAKELATSRRARRGEVAAFLAALREHGELALDDDPVAASARFLARTPSSLVGLALDDLAGETKPVNIPTATNDVYPCWSRRMRTTVEEITSDPRFVRIVTDVVARRRGVNRARTSGTA